MPDSSQIFYPLLAAFALFCLVTGFMTGQGEGLAFGFFAFLTIWLAPTTLGTSTNSCAA
mgnify:CR=1 FL=1